MNLFRSSTVDELNRDLYRMTKSKKKKRESNPANRKTELCDQWLTGHCPKEDCFWAHGCAEIVRDSANCIPESVYKSMSFKFKWLRARYPANRKTEFCDAWLDGHCAYENCFWAHGRAEIVRPLSVSFRLKYCEEFIYRGDCARGIHCPDVHNDEEIPVKRDGLYKTDICYEFRETGHCSSGLRCSYAHGNEDLRTVGNYHETSHYEPHALYEPHAPYGPPPAADPLLYRSFPPYQAGPPSMVNAPVLTPPWPSQAVPTYPPLGPPQPTLYAAPQGPNNDFILANDEAPPTAPPTAPLRAPPTAPSSDASVSRERSLSPRTKFIQSTAKFSMKIPYIKTDRKSTDKEGESRERGSPKKRIEGGGGGARGRRSRSRERERSLKDNGRLSKDDERSSKDDGRSSKENGTSSKGNGRLSKDDGRSSKHNRRLSKDDGRSSKDDGRSSKDDGRLSKDDGRLSKNDGRSSKDDGRASKDDERSSKDDGRSSREKRRSSKDIETEAKRMKTSRNRS